MRTVHCCMYTGHQSTANRARETDQRTSLLQLGVVLGEVLVVVRVLDRHVGVVLRELLALLMAVRVVVSPTIDREMGCLETRIHTTFVSLLTMQSEVEARAQAATISDSKHHHAPRGRACPPSSPSRRAARARTRGTSTRPRSHPGSRTRTSLAPCTCCSRSCTRKSR